MDERATSTASRQKCPSKYLYQFPRWSWRKLIDAKTCLTLFPDIRVIVVIPVTSTDSESSVHPLETGHTYSPGLGAVLVTVNSIVGANSRQRSHTNSEQMEKPLARRRSIVHHVISKIYHLPHSKHETKEARTLSRGASFLDSTTGGCWRFFFAEMSLALAVAVLPTIRRSPVAAKRTNNRS